MGLIKNNVKWKGYTLPSVYARVKVNTERNEATFYLGFNREMAFADPIDKVKMPIMFSHEVDPRKEAYEYAKGTYEEMVTNQETFKPELKTFKREFFGWEDDFVGE